MHYVRKQRKVGINRIPVTLIVVYDMVNGKENGKSKHNYLIYLCSIYPL